MKRTLWLLVGIILALSYQSASAADTKVYLRGDMNNWEASPDWELTNTSGNNYQIDHVYLNAGQAFKIADSDYSTLNCGYGAITNCTVGTAYTLRNSSTSANITLDINLYDATITFNKSTQRFTIVSNDTVNPYDEQYLRGNLPDASDWSAIDKYKFRTTNGYLYILGPITIPEGTEFKIADKRWNTAMTHGSKSDDESQIIDFGFSDNSYIGFGANLKIARELSNVCVVFHRGANMLYIRERVEIGLFNHTTNEFLTKQEFLGWANITQGSFLIDTPLEEAQEVSLRVIKYEYNNEDGAEVVSECIDYGPESTVCNYYGNNQTPSISLVCNDNTIKLPKTFSGEVSYSITGDHSAGGPIPTNISLTGGKSAWPDLYLQGTFDDTPNQELLEKYKFSTEDGVMYTYGPIDLPYGLKFAISDGSGCQVYASNNFGFGQYHWYSYSDTSQRTTVRNEYANNVMLQFDAKNYNLTVVSPYTYALYDVDNNTPLAQVSKIDSSVKLKYPMYGQTEPLNLCIKRISEYATEENLNYGPESEMEEITLPGGDSEDYFTAELSCNGNMFKLLPPEQDNTTLVVSIELTNTVPTAVSMKYEGPFTRVYLTRSVDNYQCLPEWEMTTTDGTIYTLENIYKSETYGSYYRIQDPSGSVINYGYSSSTLSLSSNNTTSANLTAKGNNFRISGTLNNATLKFYNRSTSTTLYIYNNQQEEDDPDLYLCGALENAPNNECIEQYKMTKGSEYYTYGPTLLPNDFSFKISDCDHSNDYTFGLPASTEDCLVDLLKNGNLQLSKGNSTKQLTLPNYDDKVYLLLKHDKENRTWHLSANTEHGIYVYDAKREQYDYFDEYSMNTTTKQVSYTLNYDDVSYETNWQIEYDQFSYPTPGEATSEYQRLGLYGLAEDYVITGNEDNLQLELVENGPGSLIVRKTYSGSVSFTVNYESEFKPTSLLVSADGDVYHPSIYFIDQSETPEEHIQVKSWTCPLESFDQCAVVEMTPTEQYTYLNGKVCPVWTAIFTGIPDKLIISGENFKLDETTFTDRAFYTNNGYVGTNFQLLSQEEWQSRVDSWNGNYIYIHWNEENVAVSSPLCHLVSSDENLEDVIQSIATYDATTTANDEMYSLWISSNDYLYYQEIPSAEDKTYTDVVFYFYDSNNELVNYYVASYADGFEADHFNKYIYNKADEHRAPQTYLSYTDLDELICQGTTELFVIGKGDSDNASITLTRTDGSEEKLTYDPTRACKVDADDDEFFFDLTPIFGNANTARIKMSRVDVAKYRAKVDNANALRDMATFNLRNVGIKTFDSGYWNWLGDDYKTLFSPTCTMPLFYDNVVFKVVPDNDYDLVLEHYVPNTDGSIADDATAYFIDGHKYSMIVDLHSDCQSIAMTSFDRVPSVTGYLTYANPELISDYDADTHSSVRFNGETDNGAVIKRHVNDVACCITDLNYNNGSLEHDPIYLCNNVGELLSNITFRYANRSLYDIPLTQTEDGSLGFYAKGRYYFNSYWTAYYHTRKFFIELPPYEDTAEASESDANDSSSSSMNISMPAPEAIDLVGEYVHEGKEEPYNESSRDIYGVYVTGMDIQFATDLNSYTDYEFHIGDSTQPLRAELITADSEIYQQNKDFTACEDWNAIENCEDWSRYLRGDHHDYPATVFIHDVTRVAPGEQLQDAEIAGSISAVYPLIYQSYYTQPEIAMPRKSEVISDEDTKTLDTNSADNSDPFVNIYEYDWSGQSMDQSRYTKYGITYAYRSTPLSFTVIAPVTADVQLPLADAESDADAPVEYFTISGIRVNGQPLPGIYIQRQGNTAKKVVIH